VVAEKIEFKIRCLILVTQTDYMNAGVAFASAGI
jgi:hypothetical protein